jgi:hypothetical protein
MPLDTPAASRYWPVDSAAAAARAAPAAAVGAAIWNREPHYRNRVFSMYLFGIGTYLYVFGTDRYRKCIIVQTSTYQYILSTYQNNVMYDGHQ